MKRLIGILLLTVCTWSYADCTTQTFTYDNKMLVCTTCCDMYGNCNTNCF